MLFSTPSHGLGSIFDDIANTVDKYTPLVNQVASSYATVQKSIASGQPGATQSAPATFNPLTYQVNTAPSQSAGMTTGTKVLIGVGVAAVVTGIIYLVVAD